MSELERSIYDEDAPLLCMLFGHKWMKNLSGKSGWDYIECKRCHKKVIEGPWGNASFLPTLSRSMEK
jgi:hypothetical protein